MAAEAGPDSACTNVDNCAKALAGDTIEWYRGAGEYCPECGEALTPRTPMRALTPTPLPVPNNEQPLPGKRSRFRATRSNKVWILANTFLLPVLGCAALQEPAHSVLLTSLKSTVRIAEAETTSFVRSSHYSPPASALGPSVSLLSDAFAPSAGARWLRRRPPGFALAVTTVGARERLPDYHLVLSRRAVSAARLYAADIAQAAGDRRKAVGALRQWLATVPGSSPGWFRLARLQASLHDETAAAASLDRALRLDSTNDAARLERAQVMARLGRYAAAMADFKAYLAAHPGSRQVEQMEIATAVDAKDVVAELAAIDDYLLTAPDDVAMLHARAAALEASGDERAAILAWKQYLKYRPDDADVYKQIAYASERTGDLPNAVSAMSEYVRLRPTDDRQKLALAYDQVRLGQDKLAMAAFAQLKNSPDTSVATQAAAELRARITGSATGTRSAYSTVEYDSRFGDIVFGVDAYALAPSARLQPYAVLHSWDDTRSSLSAREPIVYNDNAEVFGGGIRYNLGPTGGKYFFAEAGEQISLIGRGTSPELRYGFASWSESGRRGYGHTSFGFSLASYSRYGANVIGYGSILHDFPLSKAISGIVGTNFALDTHRDYWNNVGEFELGIKIGSPRFSFTLAGVDGLYLPRGSSALSRRSYTTLRPSITWSPHL